MFESFLANRTVGVLWEALPRILSAGLTMTIPLTLISFSLAMVIAVAVALVQYAHVPVLSQIARFYIWVMRGTPVLVQLFVVFYGLPGVGILIEPFPAAVLVFSINEGAYCAETVRAALEAVPQGQMEAGQCVGMSYLQIIRCIILPQAMSTSMPAFMANVIFLLKETSVFSAISLMDLMFTAKDLIGMYSKTIECLFLLVAFYLIILLPVSIVGSLIERRLRYAGFGS